MHPLVPVLACYGMGLALLSRRGGEHDGLLAGALAFPLGAAVTALSAFGLLAAGIPLSPWAFGAVWGAALVAAAFRARRHARLLWPWPAAIAALFALVALVAAHFDLSVLNRESHDLLMAARVAASGGDARGASLEVGALAAALHAAFDLAAPDHAGALVLALATAGLLAFAVLVLRSLGGARRGAITALAALALASSFPLTRSLLTVGSPAVAGLMILVFAGLWYQAELRGERRMIPLALAALAALAIDGPAGAAAAVLVGLAALVATPLLSPRRAWRAALVRLPPGARLLAAVAAGFLPLLLAGGAGRAAIASAPAALFAGVALAAGRRPAVPSLLERAPGRRLLGLADLRLLLATWLLGALFAAGLEWALLAVQAGGRSAGALQIARLLPLGLGNLLPYALAAALLLAAADLAERVASGRIRWPRLVVSAGAALLAAPYAVWLARYTFSGPQAQEMHRRSLFVALVAIFVALAFAAAIGFSLLRRTHRRFAVAIAAALTAVAAATLWVNRAGLQNEYVPLHAFIAVWTVLLATLAGRELALVVGERLEQRSRLVWSLAAGAALWSAASGIILARAHGDAWLLWGETGASRYLTRRWTFLTPVPDRPADLPVMVIKPQVESERAARLRAERAAAPPPNIVIFTVDSLRQDRVGAYGYTRRRVTPNIDRFAARGVRFTRAFTSFPATQVFNSCLLLGRYVVFDPKQQPAGYQAEAVTRLLDQRGYHIFVKSWLEPSSKSRFRPEPFKIDTYVPKGGHDRPLEEPLEQGMARLERHLDEARARGEPVLIWMHMLGAHMKATHFVADPAFDFGDSPMDLYESAVAGMDRWLGAVEERMASRLDPARPTIWIISADHGTNPTTRSRDLYEPIVRVPLVIASPGVAPGVDDHPVDVSLDVAATVVDLAGIAPPAGYDGVSLVPLLAGLPVEAMRDRLIPLSFTGWSGAVHGRYKYMRQSGVESLFDLVADPAEKRNLIGGRFDLAYWMADAARRELEARQARADAARAAGP